MNWENGQACPICGLGVLNQKCEDREFTYKGHKRVYPGLRVFRCSKCGEGLYKRRDELKLEKFLTDSRRQIDGLLTSAEIKEIRSRLGFTQKQLSDLLEVGEKTFARYESGQVVQGKAMDALLRIFREYPKAIKVLEGKPSIGVGLR